MADVIALHIVSPEGTLADAMASAVTLPGTLSRFEVLKDHGAIVSSLEKGEVVYVSGGKEYRMAIASGFVEVHDNQVTACVET